MSIAKRQVLVSQPTAQAHTSQLTTVRPCWPWWPFPAPRLTQGSNRYLKEPWQHPTNCKLSSRDHGLLIFTQGNLLGRWWALYRGIWDKCTYPGMWLYITNATSKRECRLVLPAETLVAPHKRLTSLQLLLTFSVWLKQELPQGSAQISLSLKQEQITTILRMARVGVRSQGVPNQGQLLCLSACMWTMCQWPQRDHFKHCQQHIVHHICFSKCFSIFPHIICLEILSAVFLKAPLWITMKAQACFKMDWVQVYYLYSKTKEGSTTKGDGPFFLMSFLFTAQFSRQLCISCKRHW